jgi:hypothetical protein
MKTQLFFISLIIVALVPSALATTVSFEDGSGFGPSSFNVIAIYPNASTGYIGSYNTSSNLDLDPNNSYIIRLTPDRIDYFRNPLLALQNASQYTTGNWVPLIVIIILIAVLVFKK